MESVVYKLSIILGDQIPILHEFIGRWNPDFLQQTIGDHMAGSLPATEVARPIETSLNVVMQTDQII